MSVADTWFLVGPNNIWDIQIHLVQTLKARFFYDSSSQIARIWAK